MDKQNPGASGVVEAAADALRSNIVMLPIHDLHPHPDNPRKDVGDVTELAESIKVNGVLQNLTVVPGHRMTNEEWREICARYKKKPTEEDRELMNKKWLGTGYTVIIGHRRLAASKQAELSELPCVIVEMTHKEQVSTMLTENMQRVDLSIYEQAQGFQMMLDMGDSMEEIAEKSGFSKSTVRRRLEIAQLDPKALKRASSRQISLGDFDELAKIDDIDVRNKLLSSIGTANFRNDLQNALRAQKLAKKMKEWLEVIRTFATEDPSANYQNRQYVRNYGYYSMGIEAVVPDDKDTVKYFYKVSSDQIDLFKEKDLEKEAAENAEREERQRRADLRRQRFEDVNIRHYDLRREFVKKLSNSVCKKNTSRIYGLVLNTLHTLADTYSRDPVDMKKLSYLLGVKVDEREMAESRNITDCAGIRTALEAFPEKTLFCMAYCVADDVSNGYWEKIWSSGRYDYIYKENAALNALLSLLESLGYEMSDEEEKMQSGNHVVFLPHYGEEEPDPESDPPAEE